MRILLRPILLILEQSYCLSTASFDILSHFPRSGSREGIWSQFDSPPLKKQLSSLHCVWRELVKCAVFPPSIPNAQVCWVRWGKSASWQKCALSSKEELIFDMSWCLMEGLIVQQNSFQTPPFISKSLQSKTDNMDTNIP